MVAARELIFSPEGWREPDQTEPPETIAAADSFLLSQGSAVAWRRHWARFLDAATEAGADSHTASAFLDAALDALPRQGQWFPRLDYCVSSTTSWFRLLIREAPPQSESAVLAVAPEDTRQVPWRKGPDLDRMATLRASVAPLGATEALIVADDGVVVEGAYSSVLVWSPDGSELHTTPSHYPRITSVTEEIVCSVVQEKGVRVAPRATTIAHLSHREVWVVSALHGIRLVSSIRGGPPLVTDSSRRDAYQTAWWNQATPLEAAS